MKVLKEIKIILHAKKRKKKIERVRRFTSLSPAPKAKIKIEMLGKVPQETVKCKESIHQFTGIYLKQ